MKALLLSSFSLLLAAANVSAQDPEVAVGPPILLERAQLIEEREGDLAAAEKAYRDLLADPAAVAVHDRAALRLGALLWRLDRRDEAEPLLQRAAQADELLRLAAAKVRGETGEAAKIEQERAARATALVERYVDVLSSRRDDKGALTDAASSKLRQLGDEMDRLSDATAAAIIAWLRERSIPDGGNTAMGQMLEPSQQPVLFPLVAMLWTLSGPTSCDYLTAVAQGDDLHWQRFVTAVASSPDVNALPAMIAFSRLDDPTRELFQNVIRSFRQLDLELISPLVEDEHPDTALAALLASTLRLRGQETQAWGSFLRAHEQRLIAWATSGDLRYSEAAWKLFSNALQFGYATPTSCSIILAAMLRSPANCPKDVKVQGNVPDDGGMLEQLAAMTIGQAPIVSTDAATPAQRLAMQLLASTQPEWGKDRVELMLRLIDRGYCRGTVQIRGIPRAYELGDTAQRAQLIRLLPMMGNPLNLTELFGQLGVTPELFPAIRETLNAWREVSSRPSWCVGSFLQRLFEMAAWSGHPEAGDWLVDQIDVWPDMNATIAWYLCVASRAGAGAKVHECLRAILISPDSQQQNSPHGTQGMNPYQRTQILAELIRVGDVATIPELARAYQLGLQHVQLYLRARGLRPGEADGLVVEVTPQGQSLGLHPLQMLAMTPPGHRTPWHGYDDAHLVAAWRELLTGEATDAVWHDLETNAGLNIQLPTCTLPLVAEELKRRPAQPVLYDLREALGALTQATLLAAPAMRVAVQQLLDNETLGCNAYAMLQSDVARSFGERALQRLRDTGDVGWIRRLTERQIQIGVDEWRAALRQQNPLPAVQALPTEAPAELEADVVALLLGPSEHVRIAAAAAMARAFPTRAPATLLPMLQDNEESVRNAVREQLDLLREAQEQRQFWARVQGGVDLTPQATSQKLVQQAQPDQPSAQRVLAIRSLAAVGATEALPLLIEWSKDQDAAVKAAADAAIASILQKAEASK
ncbi:MAG: tetratricopeptide repeat protein [Planctomycetota bacterium]